MRLFPIKMFCLPLDLMLSPFTDQVPRHKNAGPYVQRVSTETRNRTKRATRGLVSKGR